MTESIHLPPVSPENMIMNHWYLERPNDRVEYLHCKSEFWLRFKIKSNKNTEKKPENIKKITETSQKKQYFSKNIVYFSI